MNFFKRSGPAQEAIPTLTEVVSMPLSSTTEMAPSVAMDVGTDNVPQTDEVTSAAPVLSLALSLPSGPVATEITDAVLGEWSQDELIQQILVDVQRQVDAMMEYRLREALGPALTRLTDALVRDARAELSAVLKDVVSRSVAQELSRHRPK